MLGLLNWIGLDYWVSTFIGNTVGVAVSYMLNRSYTFHSNVNWFRGLVRFTVVCLSCYFIAYGIGKVLAERYLTILFSRADHLLLDNMAILAGMVLYTGLNYIGQKYIVFRGSLSGG
jgi:putative flippase GtrA